MRGKWEESWQDPDKEGCRGVCVIDRMSLLGNDFPCEGIPDFRSWRGWGVKRDGRVAEGLSYGALLVFGGL